jgi:hypothetical protein
MAKFKKKPVVIDAVQFGTNDVIKQSELAEFLRLSEMAHYRDGDDLIIRTLEGEMRASPNDWIIKGVKGELYPCKPDIFKETYEEVEEDGCGGKRHG